MSHKGKCMDNAPMENSFGIMKNEMFYGHEREFGTLEELKSAMDENIYYYNMKRITEKLKGLTPVDIDANPYKTNYLIFIMSNLWIK